MPLQESCPDLLHSHAWRGHSHLEGKIGMEAAPVPKAGNSRSELSSSSLPVDLALNVVSYLQAADVCSLGSCSRFWRRLCASDCVWIALYKRRWPALGADSQPRASEGGRGGGGGECSADAEALSSAGQRWRVLYINKHKMASAVSTVIKIVEQSTQNESLEVGYYLKAVAELGLAELGFEDVQLFLFARKQNVLLNLIGLHYSIFWLAVPPKDVAEALHGCKVSDRYVCVSWIKLGRWFHGFRLPGTYCFRNVSLDELAMAKKDEALEVLAVLNRGAVHEVLQVQITASTA